MICIGDTHGIQHIAYRAKMLPRGTYLIHVGDVGIGFISKPNQLKELDRLNQVLFTNGIYLYAIRGNHDDPAYWNGDYQDTWSNIKFVHDYSFLTIEDKKVLFMGGAISIDRTGRTESRDYWKDEIFDYDEEELQIVLKQHGVPHIVITHTAPTFAMPRTMGSIVHHYAMQDPNLIDELHIERALVSRAYETIKVYGTPQKWIYGHFHNSYKEIIDGTEFILLDIAEEIKI